MGRWRDGRSLVRWDLSDPGPRPESNYPFPLSLYLKRRVRINHFRYGRDEDGLRCPLGAHVRRANPRDGLGWQGRPTKRHRIVRRSMPYGPERYDISKGPQSIRDLGIEDEKERGIMFVCHQASIARQFEFIQTSWLNDGDPFWLGEERDLLAVGAQEPPSPDLMRNPPAARLTIQGEPPRFLVPQEPFVTTRGGEYYFTPGLSALRALASAYWR